MSTNPMNYPPDSRVRPSNKMLQTFKLHNDGRGDAWQIEDSNAKG